MNSHKLHKSSHEHSGIYIWIWIEPILFQATMARNTFKRNWEALILSTEYTTAVLLQQARIFC